jgi:hypothetical protein
MFRVFRMYYRLLKFRVWLLRVGFREWRCGSRTCYQLSRYSRRLLEGGRRLAGSVYRVMVRYRLFSYHGYKEMRWVKVWVEVGDSVRILEERLEPPEAYHKRKKNVYLVTLFGFTFRFRIPWR